MNCKIYVVSHKAFSPPSNSLYVPIQVGKTFSKMELGFLSDDTGNNIAEKNKTYCELTALYWIWKNEVEADILGLCHYRRYFSKFAISNSTRFFLNDNDIERLLKRSDIIVPQKTNLHEYNVAQWYSKCNGRREDLNKTIEVLKAKCPEYISSFQVILDSHMAFYCNIFIMSRDRLNSYCEWLFDILETLETQIDLSDYSAEEARIYGYISEILLNVWVYYNQLTFHEIPVVNTQTSLKWKILHS